ncbi:MAG: hypothetical protein ACK50L_02485 [Bacteroidota bacterium]
MSKIEKIKNQLPTDGVVIKLAMELPQKPQKPSEIPSTTPPSDKK